MEELLNESIKKIKKMNFETQKMWNRYAVRNNLLSAETVMYITNKSYSELRGINAKK